MHVRTEMRFPCFVLVLREEMGDTPSGLKQNQEAEGGD